MYLCDSVRRLLKPQLQLQLQLTMTVFYFNINIVRMYVEKKETEKNKLISYTMTQL